MTIALLTDFGLSGPYIGQVKAVLSVQASSCPVIDLFSDLPAFNPRSAAYLIPAYCAEPFPKGSIFLCVVDPGVGTERNAVIVYADGYWFVGPDNGLFAIIVRRARVCRCWVISWQPEKISHTFHGRDLFAPVAASLFLALQADGDIEQGKELHLPYPIEPIAAQSLDRPEWPNQHWAVCYIDHYGNAILGAQGQALFGTVKPTLEGRPLPLADTFGAVSPGSPFCYINSNGLVEIAVNGGSAAEKFNLKVGSFIQCMSAGEGDKNPCF